MNDLSRLDKWTLMHIAIGGGICFFVMFLLRDLAQTGLLQILANFGVIGVMVFTEPMLYARAAFMFGVVYVTSGFCGGLYTGYNLEENLNIVLSIPGLIGFSAFMILNYFLGSLDPSSADFAIDIGLLLIGNVAGSYLGGYTMNWPGEEAAGEVEKLRIDLGK